ncbi:hypothetical protein [Zobellella iuensis]|uniref:DUF2946 domain-containing protein n=1 Tax=Zobellella iuensis TaxID=2803811 RepID=A0ABS1QLM2_9GAMM|nr:hypothetical protein [Zobellella iuensis]MBL1375755.1 hypothetical protein [Zobellella iuensis]
MLLLVLLCLPRTALPMALTVVPVGTTACVDCPAGAIDSHQHQHQHQHQDCQLCLGLPATPPAPLRASADIVFSPVVVGIRTVPKRLERPPRS